MLKNLAIPDYTLKVGLICTFFIWLVLGNLPNALSSTLHQTRPENTKPIIFKPMKAQADININSSKNIEKLEAHVEESRNLDVLLPESDWKRAYSIGRDAFMDKDYSRAFNAFQLAYLRTKVMSANDPRIAMTINAVNQVQNLSETLSARAGYLTNSTPKGQLIEKVFPGSLAWLAGIRAGDRILFAHSAHDLIKLTVERNGQKYSVKLHDLNPTQDTQTSSAKESRTMLRGQTQITDLHLLAQNEKLLTNHDAIILIDKSGSMQTADCPGSVTRWQWCRTNTAGLVQATTQYFHNQLTIIPFDSQFQVYKNADFNQVYSIFDSLKPFGGTHPENPLANQLDDYFARRERSRSAKPLIIAIITDGNPNNAEALRDVIFDATTRMRSKNEICITFLQVGGHFTNRILNSLDNDLVNAGAMYDIVDTTSFDDLQKIGMKNALIAALFKQAMDDQDKK